MFTLQYKTRHSVMFSFFFKLSVLYTRRLVSLLFTRPLKNLFFSEIVCITKIKHCVFALTVGVFSPINNIKGSQ